MDVISWLTEDNKAVIGFMEDTPLIKNLFQHVQACRPETHVYPPLLDLPLPEVSDAIIWHILVFDEQLVREYIAVVLPKQKVLASIVIIGHSGRVEKLAHEHEALASMDIGRLEPNVWLVHKVYRIPGSGGACQQTGAFSSF
jgi:hypothetical protein